MDIGIDRGDPIGFDALRKKVFPLLQKLEDSDVKLDGLVKELKEYIDLGVSDDESSFKRQTVDSLFREYMLENVVKKAKPWTPLVSFSVALAKEGTASALLPIALLLDLIDLLGLEDCEEAFLFIEERLSLWQEPLFYSHKNAVLRMCNDLLRRLSQTQNTIFCGRILIFLSTYFPFSERSGLNVMSEFNAENVTLYKTTDGSDDPDDSMNLAQEKEETLFEGMDIEIPGLDKVVAQCQEKKKKNMSVDYSMYVKFWSLQDFLRNPNLCYNKTKWKTFTMYLNDLLLALESSKLLVEPALPGPNATEETAMEIDEPVAGSSTAVNPQSCSKLSGFSVPSLEDENHYFAKYLTNRRVLELEICDPHFRKSFLVQVLIVLQYLLMPVKFKSESFVLNEEQTQFVSKTTDRVFTILSQIKPGGPKFVASVKHTLKREEIWNKWKNEGCPPLKKPTPPPVNVSTDPKLQVGGKPEAKKSSSTATTAAAADACGNNEATKSKPMKRPRPRLGLILKNADKRNKYSLGSSELNRLWNIYPDNLGACREKTRDFMPSIETYFAEAMKELDQEPVLPFDPKRVVKPKKILGNVNFGWRGLRLLARRSPYFFQMVSGTPIHPLQNYLEFVLRKIAADLDTPTPESSSKPKSETSSPSPSQTTKVENSTNGDSAERDTEMVSGTPEEDEDLSRADGKPEDERAEIGPDVRNLSEAEQEALGKRLGGEWKKLGQKLGFSSDELEFFSTEHKDNPGSYMLKVWTEQEGDDATVADLLYRLDGLGLRAKADGLFSS